MSGSQLAFVFDVPAAAQGPVSAIAATSERNGGSAEAVIDGQVPARGLMVSLLADPSPHRYQTARGDLSYELRVSKRARRLTLRVMPGRGLVVTAPKRFARRDVAAFVESNRAWVEAALHDLHARTPALYREWPPESLYLAFSGETLSVTFEPQLPGAGADARLQRSELIVRAARDDKASVASLVAALLQPVARELLLPRLAALAHQHGLTYRRAAIRGQRSVWGSYSSSGTLSLNYKLLFLSPQLVDYVLLHELAHTEYLDHSDAFWARLCQLEPLARELDGALNAAAALVPPWLELARAGLVSRVIGLPSS